MAIELTVINNVENVTITIAEIQGPAGADGATTFAALTDAPEDNALLAAALDAKQDTLTGTADVPGLTAALAGKAPTVHTHVIGDTTGLQAALDAKALDSDLDTHTANTSNPHSVTAAQVGAYTTGQTDTLLAAKQDDLTGVSDVPGLTAALAAKADDTDLANYQLLSGKGVANGYASLGSDGLVPTAQLPTVTAPKLYTGGTDLPYADAAEVQSALGIVTFNAAYDLDFIQYRNSAGKLADSKLLQGSGLVSLDSAYLYLTDGTAPSSSQYGLGKESGASRLQAPTGGAHRRYVSATCVENVTSSGLAVGKGTTASSAFLESFGTTEQLRLTYSSGVDLRVTVDASGIPTFLPSGTHLRIAKKLGFSGGQWIDFGSGTAAPSSTDYGIGLDPSGNIVLQAGHVALGSKFYSNSTLVLSTVAAGVDTFKVSSGTTNALVKYDGTTLVNSGISDNGTTVSATGRFWYFDWSASAGLLRLDGSVGIQAGWGTRYYNLDTSGHHFTGANVGIGHLGVPSAALDIRSTTEQLRLEYSSGVDARHTVDASGNYIISPTGGRIGVGKNANPSGALSSAFGQGATSSGDLSFAAGINAISSGYGSFSILGNASADYSMAFGYSSASAVANTAVFGAGDSPINTIWAGKGAPHATPTLWSIRGTSGLGSNITGGDIAVDAGAGTGTNVGATGRLRATSALASGTTLQTTWVDALTWTSAGVTGLLANGFTISGTELGYLDGATSNIQAQIDDVYSTSETDTAISTAIGGLSTVLYSGGATMPYANLAAVQSALGIVAISGLTTNYLPKWNGTTFANSSLSEATATKVDLAGRLNFSATNAGGSYTESWIARQGSNYLTINSQDYILVNISAAAGGLGDFRFGAYGLGFRTYASVPFQARSTTEQLRLEYSSGVDARFTVDSAGKLTISNIGTDIAIGNTAVASGGHSTSMGSLASATGSYSAAFGKSATSSIYGVAIGANAAALGESVTVGYYSSSYNQSVALGYNAYTTASAAIAIGLGAAATIANTMVIGAAAPYSVNTIFAGKGAPSATPTLWSIRGTSALGTDIAGGDIAVDAGAGTGAGATGLGHLRATTVLTTGTTLQSTWNNKLSWNSVGLGLHGATPVAQSTGWSVANPVTNKTLDVSTATLGELREIVGTLVAYLLTRGDIGA